MNCINNRTSPMLHCIYVNGQPILDYINAQYTTLQQESAANAATAAANATAIASIQSSVAALTTCCVRLATLANQVNALLANVAGNTIEIPFDAFADPGSPTQAEAQTWIDANQPHTPGTLIIYGTDLAPGQDNESPGWVWLIDPIGDAIALKEPAGTPTAATVSYDNSNSALDQHTVQAALDVLVTKVDALALPHLEPIRIADSAVARYNNPTDDEVAAWILANYPDAASGQTFIYSVYKPLANPDFIWTKLGDTLTRTKELPFISHEIDPSAFADPNNPTIAEAQSYINARAPHLPGSFWVYPGTGDETNPDLLFFIDSIGDPIHVH